MKKIFKKIGRISLTAIIVSIVIENIGFAGGPEFIAPPPPPPPCNLFYFSGGILALKPYLSDSRPLILRDPNIEDTGNPPPPGAPVVMKVESVAKDLNYGPVGSIKWMHNEIFGLEIGGFYLPKTTSKIVNENANSLDLPFFNPPPGFEGDNGMWLQADRVITRFKSFLASGDFNARLALPSLPWIQFIFGGRYFEMNQRLSIFTGDDDLIVIPNDPTRQATYTTKANGHLWAGQVGAELTIPLIEWLDLNILGKEAFGESHSSEDTTLVRGDGFLGFKQHRHAKHFTTLTEAGAFLNIHTIALPSVGLRVGYNLIYVDNMATANSLVDFNLANTISDRNGHRNVFFGGPMAELQVVF